MNNYAIYGEEFLAHHGILGQKWGKRNGPPYPLDPEDHSKAEKEAAKKRTDMSDETKEKLKKAAIIGAAVVGTALIAYGAYKVSKFIKVSKSGSMTGESENGYTPSYWKLESNIAFKNKKFLNEQYRVFNKTFNENRIFESFEDVPKAEHNYKNEVFKNKNFNNLLFNTNLDKNFVQAPDRQDNCVMCTSSLIMKLKGYETRASSYTGDGFNLDVPRRIFKGSHIEKIDSHSSDDLIARLLENGNNRYGYLDVCWKHNQLHHSLLYATIDNEVYFGNGQKDALYPAEILFKKIIIDNTRFLDVTDIYPNEDILGMLVYNI